MSWLGLGRKDREATIHAIRMKVKAGSRKLPVPLIVAYVTAFSIAAEPREAVVNSVRALRAMGYDFEDIVSEGFSMPLGDWGKYLGDA